MLIRVQFLQQKEKKWEKFGISQKDFSEKKAFLFQKDGTYYYYDQKYSKKKKGLYLRKFSLLKKFAEKRQFKMEKIELRITPKIKNL